MISDTGQRCGRAVVTRLQRSGRLGRRLALELDDVLLLGPRATLRSGRLRDHGGLGSELRHRVYRGMWASAAAAVGAEMQDLGGGFWEFHCSGRVTRVYGQLTELDDPVAMRLAGNKALSLRRLAEAGVPVPSSFSFDAGEMGPAAARLGEMGRCVVKPAVGTSGGEGVTGGVRTVEDLRRAVLRAARFSDELLLERQVDGLLHRLLLLDGRLLDVVVDLPAHVTGDGRSDVGQLVEAENRHRISSGGHDGLELIDVDLDVVLALRESGMTLASVVPAGRRVRVRTVSNDRGPRDSWTYRGAVHPDVVQHARAAVEAFGLRLAGVDVLAPGIDRPLAPAGGVLLEVNAAPGLLRHYQVQDPARATRVAEPVLERLLSQAPAVTEVRWSRADEADSRLPRSPAAPLQRTAAAPHLP